MGLGALGLFGCVKLPALAILRAHNYIIQIENNINIYQNTLLSLAIGQRKRRSRGERDGADVRNTEPLKYCFCCLLCFFSGSCAPHSGNCSGTVATQVCCTNLRINKPGQNWLKTKTSMVHGIKHPANYKKNVCKRNHYIEICVPISCILHFIVSFLKSFFDYT